MNFENDKEALDHFKPKGRETVLVRTLETGKVYTKERNPQVAKALISQGYRALGNAAPVPATAKKADPEGNAKTDDNDQTKDDPTNGGRITELQAEEIAKLEAKVADGGQLTDRQQGIYDDLTKKRDGE